VTCPICADTETAVVRRHSAALAAQHFVPRRRDRARHEALRRKLVELWGREWAELRRCAGCGAVCVDPFVGGDAAFYELLSGGNPGYPGWRWEFGRTLRSLETLRTERPLHLLELGAGDGAFLRCLDAEAFAVTALEHDVAAVRRLHDAGIAVYAGSAQELANERAGGFDVVALFQTLEHIAAPHELFAAFRHLLRPDGHLFLSVPNAAAVELEEELTGFFEMPPHHVSRWSERALSLLAAEHGLTVVEHDLEPAARLRTALIWARYRVLARGYDDRTLAARVNGIRSPRLRNAARLALSIPALPRSLVAARTMPPLTRWAHLRRV
jgi:2-polyprenyl-3-methyl-5-hydroxy-6-metoxy-1,4-benzoquinol methylase